MSGINEKEARMEAAAHKILVLQSEDYTEQELEDFWEYMDGREKNFIPADELL
jgi:hypothetical protein